MNIIITYIVYLMLSAILVLLVGYWFYHFGELYIIMLMPFDVQTARLLNSLLLLGYYLLNLGFILLFLRQINSLQHWNESILFIAKNLSTNIIVVALMHYLNMLWLYLLSISSFLHHNKNQKI